MHFKYKALICSREAWRAVYNETPQGYRFPSFADSEFPCLVLESEIPDRTERAYVVLAAEDVRDLLRE